MKHSLLPEPSRSASRSLRSALALLVTSLLPALALVAAPACGEESGVLVVDLKSDFVPGAEVSSVHLEFSVAGSTGAPVTIDTAVGAGDDLLGGIRLAELAAEVGTYDLVVGLRDAAAAEVLERRVVVEVRGTTGVTVLATRSCGGVVCDSATTCVAGECVDPRCTPETPETCAPDQCATDGDCAGNDCVVATCDQGACFAFPDEARCMADQTCSVADGCVPPVEPPPTGPPEDALLGVTGLGAGAKHICVVIAGEVRCWGDNASGQLGDGTTMPSGQPGAGIAGLTGGRLALGDDFSCVTTGAGVSCWGDNSVGQIAQGASGGSLVPVVVDAAVSIGATFGAGGRHACATEEGLCISPGPCTHDAYCWGDNGSGQIGDGSTTARGAATRVDFGDSLYRFAGGGAHSCLDTFSGLFCWGSNTSGQLGLGDTTSRSAPTEVFARAPFSQPLRGLAAGYAHTCAVDPVGALTCWGENDNGQVGDGTMGMLRSSAVPVTLGDGSGQVVAVSLGDNHSCAVRDDGSVWCWGANESGQLGDGTTTPRPVPTRVPLDDEATDVVAGGAFSCAVTIDTLLVCWGANESGQLGDGTIEGRPTPDYVIDPLWGGGTG